jgi:cytochrome c-type biogenesis protein CcsB
VVNEALAHLSDLAFECAMAGYVVAMVCYGIDFAGRRIQPTAAEAASAQLRAAARAGGTTVMTRPDGVGPGGIGVVPKPTTAPWGVRFGRAGTAVAVIACAANILSIICRGFAAGRLPLANMYEFTSMICAAATLTWLIVLARTGARQLGLFVMLPVALLAFLAGTVLYTPAGPVVPALNSYWKWIHVTTVSLSGSVLLVSGAASAMYILRARYERKLAVARAGGDDARVVDLDGSSLSKLPSLATLDRIAYRTCIVAFPIYTFAIIAGAMWAELAWGRYWGWDPKETVAFISWVLYACYLHARATAGWRGVRAAWISVLGFAAIIFNLFFVNMVVSGLHSYAGLN